MINLSCPMKAYKKMAVAIMYQAVLCPIFIATAIFNIIPLHMSSSNQ